MKIAMLTGGGDVPGLNPALKGLATGALAEGWEVIGICNGWAGLLQLQQGDPESFRRWIRPLDEHAVRTIDRNGGTFLHSSRTNPGNVAEEALPAFLRNSSRVRPRQGAAPTSGAIAAATAPAYDCTQHVLHNLAALGVDVLFAIGGDDTLSYGERLHHENFSVIGIPKTMDNDVHGTDYCLGFATCVSRSVAFLNDLRTCAGSHERFAIVECMGRNSGATALIPAYLASVDRALIAEVPFDVEKLAGLLQRDRRDNPSQYAMVTVSEGATMRGGQVVESGEADAYGHRKLGGIGQLTGDRLRDITGVGIIYQNLGYLVRCGPPDPLDVMVTYNFANLALELARKKRFGNLVRVKDGVYGYAPMSILSEGKKTVEVDAFYDADAYRPKIATVMGMPMFLR